jgi:hypothetical protein
MPEPLEVRPHHLAGLCLVTETNRPEEFPAILQVILNRVASPRYPDTVEEVILQRKQFSRFNALTVKTRRLRADTIYRMVVREDIRDSRIDPLLLAHAQDFARDCFARGDLTPGPTRATMWIACTAISPQTLHYYSPISMVPKGSAPPWAKTAKRLYGAPGIDMERFTWAEGVK